MITTLVLLSVMSTSTAAASLGSTSCIDQQVRTSSSVRWGSERECRLWRALTIVRADLETATTALALRDAREARSKLAATSSTCLLQAAPVEVSVGPGWVEWVIVLVAGVAGGLAGGLLLGGGR